MKKRVYIVFAVWMLVILCKSVLSADEVVLSHEVYQIVEKKVALVKKELAADPVIIANIRKANEHNRNISLAEIFDMDKSWQELRGGNEVIKQYIFSPCGLQLIDFQDAYDGYSEIFATDEKGLIVGMTNKTSDYYQADEGWWQKAYAEGKGREFYGSIEYDESAKVEAIAAYIPVVDPETDGVIGILKVVIDVTSIKMEL